jgi:hypothetical protein
MGLFWFAAGAAVGGYVGYKVGKAAGSGQPMDLLRAQTAPASAAWSYDQIQDPDVYEGDYVMVDDVVRPAG